MLTRTSVDPAATGPVAAARVRLARADGRLLAAVPVDGPHASVDTDLAAGPAGRRLVVAEPAAWASRAVVTVGGQVLRAQPGTGFPTYDVPSGGGRLVISLPPLHGDWLARGSLLAAGVAFLALPFGHRRSMPELMK